MDDQRRSRPEDATPKDPAEGVRIIGADEAAEAMERGDIVSRRTDDELRFGDRPPSPPAGPKPSLRFPLDASDDPTRIERPPVQPAPEPVTGPVELPHWTEPPTGEVPAVLIGGDEPLLDDDDDGDAWSSFATSAPRWRDADDDWGDDDFVERLASDSEEVRLGALAPPDEPSAEEYYGFEDMAERVEERTGDTRVIDSRSDDDDDWSASAEVDEEDWVEDVDDEDIGVEPGPGVDGPASPGGRDMGQAALVGGGLAVAALVLLVAFPTGMVLLVSVALALAAIEYFDVLRRVGWESATPVGLAACALLPFAVYWRGPVAIPLVGFLLVVAVLGWFLAGAGGPDPRVLEGSGATLLGALWIGGSGSMATAPLRLEDGAMLLLVALLATSAYDIGGLFVGRSMGSRPVSAASPSKTMEGLIGGMASAFVVALVCVGIIGIGPWEGFGAGLLLGLGAAVAAPLGDLCQSLVKRDLGVKDMGRLLPGHGGVFDRIDGMLFVVPTFFWLAVSVGHVV